MDDLGDPELQSLEVQALQFIYNEEEFITYKNEESGLIHLNFYAFITLPDNFSVIFKNDGNSSSDGENAAVQNDSESVQSESNVLKVKHLPPIELFAVLPKDYPILCPPQFNLSCSWLSADLLTKLCKKLDELWTENVSTEILYIWSTFLKEETLGFLGLENVLWINKKYLKPEEQEQRFQDKRNKPSEFQHKGQLVETDSSITINSDEKLVVTDNRVKEDTSVNSRTDVSECVKDEKPTETILDDAKCTKVQRSDTSANDTKHKCDTSVVLEKENSANKSIKGRVYTNRYFYSSSNNHSNNDNDKSRYHRKPNNYYRRYNDNYNNKYKSGYNYDKSCSRQIDKEANYDRENSEYSPSYKGGTKDTRPHGFQKFQNRGRCRRRFADRDCNYNSRTSVNSDRDNKVDVSDGKCAVVKEGSDCAKPVCSDDSVLRLQEKFDNDLLLNSSDAQSNESSHNSNRSSGSSDINLTTDKLLVDKIIGSVKIVNNKDSCINKSTSVEKCDINKDKRVKKCLSQYHVKHLSDYLENYNKDRVLTEFCKMFFCCSICYQDKVGLHCTQFKPCDHTFCKDCVSQYVQIKIDEGTVYVIKCPEDKCTSDILPSQVRDLVGPEQFARYDNMLLTTTLETMADVITCPRRTCQYPASREPDEKMAVCPACQYVFCAYCKMGYHGVEPCRFRTDEKAALVKEYLEADNDIKMAMEQKYGKKLLNSLVQVSLSETWIVNNSRNCPHCNASIEKSGGCSKMVCWRCSTYFCWLCHARLDPANPYKHYYDPKSRCHRQLFEHAVLDDEEDDFLILEDFEDEEEFEIFFEN